MRFQCACAAHEEDSVPLSPQASILEWMAMSVGLSHNRRWPSGWPYYLCLESWIDARGCREPGNLLGPPRWWPDPSRRYALRWSYREAWSNIVASKYFVTADVSPSSPPAGHSGRRSWLPTAWTGKLAAAGTVVAVVALIVLSIPPLASEVNNDGSLQFIEGANRVPRPSLLAVFSGLLGLLVLVWAIKFARQRTTKRTARDAAWLLVCTLCLMGTLLMVASGLHLTR